MSATEIRTEVPTGTWAIDNVHSTIGFAVKHNGIATFRGTFGEVEGFRLGSDGLTGTAKVESVTVASRT